MEGGGEKVSLCRFLRWPVDREFCGGKNAFWGIL